LGNYNAHTDGDTWVFFDDADVLDTGDTFGNTGRYNTIDFANGGDIRGLIRTADAYIKEAGSIDHSVRRISFSSYMASAPRPSIECETSLDELLAKLISSQPKCANPGIWPTLFNRQAKAGKGLASNAQSVDVLADRPVTRLGCSRATVCDVVAGSM
jgi:hypothetical protein